MRPPLQDFLCAFEPSDWVFPVAHSANCCVPVEPTSEAADLLNLQFNRLWNEPAPFPPEGNRKGMDPTSRAGCKRGSVNVRFVSKPTGVLRCREFQQMLEMSN